VTWSKLLASREAQKHRTSKKELDNLRALIDRDLADAAIAGLFRQIGDSRLLTTLPFCRGRSNWTTGVEYQRLDSLAVRHSRAHTNK